MLCDLLTDSVSFGVGTGHGDHGGIDSAANGTAANGIAGVRNGVAASRVAAFAIANNQGVVGVFCHVGQGCLVDVLAVGLGGAVGGGATGAEQVGDQHRGQDADDGDDDQQLDQGKTGLLHNFS